MKPFTMAWLELILWATCLTLALAQNATYINPMISGWASDPSCVHVNGTFYCALSTFIAFPGLPIYASKDLVNWKLISHAWNRDSQLPGIGLNTTNQQGGMYAPNLRYHDGVFHCTCTYDFTTGTVFKTTNPYDDGAWSDPVIYNSSSIDPDLFWDGDGKVYLTSAGIIQQEIDLETGDVTEPISIWNGTGGSSPEGPHIYKKDGYYYLMIAQGGTELGHSEITARSRNVSGPWEAYEGNPILSNANTTQYFQTVGHADLFQDGKGNWWAAALSTRSGPKWKVYPMGREAVLTPVTWEEGEWPVFTQVRGIESTWPLPPYDRSVLGEGAYSDDPDVVDFEPGSSIPSHFYYWRHPTPGTFEVSPPGHPNTLKVTPLRTNLTGMQESNDTALDGRAGLPFVGRRQTDTLFSFSVDLATNKKDSKFEAGISVFLTQLDHLDLGIANNGSHLTAVLRLLNTPIDAAENSNNYTSFESVTTSHALPVASTGEAVRLGVYTPNATHYGFTAALSENPNSKIILGYASAERVSGRSGRFTGVLLGVYNTCNGAQGNNGSCPAGGDAYLSRWRYDPVAQYIDSDQIAPSKS